MKPSMIHSAPAHMTLEQKSMKLVELDDEDRLHVPVTDHQIHVTINVMRKCKTDHAYRKAFFASIGDSISDELIGLRSLGYLYEETVDIRDCLGDYDNCFQLFEDSGAFDWWKIWRLINEV